MSDQTEQPLVPVAQRLVSSEGSYATDAPDGDTQPRLPVKDHLDEVSDSIEGQGFTKPLVHIIDREGDSVTPIRRWDAAACLRVVH